MTDMMDVLSAQQWKERRFDINFCMWLSTLVRKNELSFDTFLHLAMMSLSVNSRVFLSEIYVPLDEAIAQSSDSIFEKIPNVYRKEKFDSLSQLRRG